MSADTRKLRALLTELEYAHREDTPAHTEDALRFVAYHGGIAAAIRALDKRLGGSRKPARSGSRKPPRSGSRSAKKPLAEDEYKRVRALLGRAGYAIVRK